MRRITHFAAVPILLLIAFTLGGALSTQHRAAIAQTATKREKLAAFDGSALTNITATNLVGTLPLANGGTGRTSFTAYSLLCGGTSSTSPLQSVSDLGTAGQVLTSNGNGALPSWATNSNPDVQQITFSSYWSRPTGRKITIAFVVGSGGGGGSGRRSATGVAAYGGGPGAPGAFVWGWWPTELLPSAVYATVGLPGLPGAAQTADNTNGLAGAAGGYSQFWTLKAAGGLGGSGGTTTSGAAGSGQTSVAGGPNYANLTPGSSAAALGVPTQLSTNLATTTTIGGPTGGGPGGSISSGNVAYVGGASATYTSNVVLLTEFADGGANTGENGQAGNTTNNQSINGGLGGGGGGANLTGPGGTGGAGTYGGGGGGGGASRNGNNSGAGGLGGTGSIFVISF